MIVSAHFEWPKSDQNFGQTRLKNQSPPGSSSVIIIVIGHRSTSIYLNLQTVIKIQNSLFCGLQKVFKQRIIFSNKHMENVLTNIIGENFETLVGDEEL